MATFRPGFQPIKASQLGGVITIIVFAGLATVALFLVACRGFFLVVRSAIFQRKYPQSDESIFFRTQLGIYAVCLLTCNAISSLAGLFGIAWVIRGGIQEGPLCITQGILVQVANIGSAYFTACLGLHAFNSFVLKSKNHARSIFAIFLGWALAITIAFLPIFYRVGNQIPYGISALSCGVKRQFPLELFLYHLLPIFIGSVISAAVFAVIFLVLRGTLFLKSGAKPNLGTNDEWNGSVRSEEDYHRFVAAILKSMLWYPFAYVVFLLPYSMTRLADLNGFAVPFQVYIFAYTCWFTLGIINVIILYGNFRLLKSALGSKAVARATSDVESFDSAQKMPFAAPAVAGPSQSSPLSRENSSSSRQNVLIRQPSAQQQQRRGSRRGRQRSMSRSNSGSSSPSMRRLVVTQQAHRTQTSEDADDATTRESGAPIVGRPITPSSESSREITPTAEEGTPPPTEPAMPREMYRPLPRLRTDDLRRTSISSLSSIGTEISLGLPPPPRYTRSPLSRQPTLEGISEEGRSMYRPPFVEESARPDTANIDPERDVVRVPPRTWASLVGGAAADGLKSPIPVMRDGPSRRANVSNSHADAEEWTGGTPPPEYL